MIMKEAKAHADKMKPVSFNVDVLEDILRDSKKKTLEVLSS